MVRQLTAIIEREGDGYVALCPDVDIASQGATVGEARDNLKEALELFFETASATEIQRRLHEGSVRHARRGRGWVDSGCSPAGKPVAYSPLTDSWRFGAKEAT